MGLESGGFGKRIVRALGGRLPPEPDQKRREFLKVGVAAAAAAFAGPLLSAIPTTAEAAEGWDEHHYEKRLRARLPAAFGRIDSLYEKAIGGATTAEKGMVTVSIDDARDAIFPNNEAYIGTSVLNGSVERSGAAVPRGSERRHEIEGRMRWLDIWIKSLEDDRRRSNSPSAAMTALREEIARVEAERVELARASWPYVLDFNHALENYLNERDLVSNATVTAARLGSGVPAPKIATQAVEEAALAIARYTDRVITWVMKFEEREADLMERFKIPHKE